MEDQELDPREVTWPEFFIGNAVVGFTLLGTGVLVAVTLGKGDIEGWTLIGSALLWFFVATRTRDIIKGRHRRKREQSRVEKPSDTAPADPWCGRQPGAPSATDPPSEIN